MQNIIPEIKCGLWKKYSNAWHTTYMFPIKFKSSSLILNIIKTLIEFDESKFLHDYILCTTSFCYEGSH